MTSCSAQCKSLAAGAYEEGLKVGRRLAFPLEMKTTELPIPDPHCRAATYAYLDKWIRGWRDEFGTRVSPVRIIRVTAIGVCVEFLAEANRVDCERVCERLSAFRDGWERARGL